MDNPPIGSSGRVDRALEPTQQVRPTPRLPVDRTDERIAQAPAHAPANALTEAELARLDDALFSLEQHVPYQLLQNPLWLKAEWAWKVLLVQHMFTSAAAAANSPLKQQQTLPVVNEPAIAQNEHAVRMPGTADEASESEQPGNFERVIQGLWSILTEASEPVASSKLVSLRMQTDPPLLHFASVGNEIFAQAHSTADRRQIERWTLQDRLTAAVIDNPYERYGAGLFFLPDQERPPYRAVKWEAERRTRIGNAGKLVHRIEINLEVDGSPVTCLITAQRPQMYVHFMSDDLSIHKHLAGGREALQEPLTRHGWELAGWSLGTSEEVF